MLAAADSHHKRAEVEENGGKGLKRWRSCRFLSPQWDSGQGLAGGRRGAMCPTDGLSKYDGCQGQMDRSILRREQRRLNPANECLILNTSINTSLNGSWLHASLRVRTRDERHLFNSCAKYLIYDGSSSITFKTYMIKPEP